MKMVWARQLDHAWIARGATETDQLQMRDVSYRIKRTWSSHWEAFYDRGDGYRLLGSGRTLKSAKRICEQFAQSNDDRQRPKTAEGGEEMRTLHENRDDAVREMRTTINQLRRARTRVGIYRAAEALAAQAHCLRDLVTHTIERGGELYPDKDWEDYTQEEHGKSA
jgi:hypothetical protein